MHLVVTAHTSDGPLSHQLSSPEAALEKAHDLAAEGHDHVVITDINGRDYTPAEFDSLFLNQGT
jgi:vacuolar-type H+-ATPase subunit B/Vma2